MAWYNFWKQPENVEEKLNPGQILDVGKSESSREFTTQYERFYEQLEVVNRGVNMIVDDAAEIPSTISTQGAFRGVVTGVKRGKVEELLNRTPNPFQDVSSFKRNLITDQKPQEETNNPKITKSDLPSEDPINETEEADPIDG